MLIFLQDSELNLYPVSFLCPNGTVFNQAVFVCDWWWDHYDEVEVEVEAEVLSPWVEMSWSFSLSIFTLFTVGIMIPQSYTSSFFEW